LNHPNNSDIIRKNENKEQRIRYKELNIEEGIKHKKN